jgi:hypothetical protein
MEPKFTVNVFDNIDKQEVREEIRKTLFKEQPINTKTKPDPMAAVMGLLSNPNIMSILRNPKKIKQILIAIAILLLIGIISTAYVITNQIINLIEYLF